MHLDLTRIEDAPLKGLRLRHPSVDRLLAERAVELGAEVRYGHRVVGVDQDDESVTVEVEGPDGSFRVTGRYLVGCDGAYSRIRDLAGIAFPGETYPDVNRLAELSVHPSVTVLENGDLDVPGVGRVAAGFTRTARGVFAFGSLGDGHLMIHTIEDEDTAFGDEARLTVEELGESIARVLGFAIPLGEPRRLSRYLHHARQADRYRAGRLFVAGDAAHVLPATGIARSVGMLDAVDLGWKLAAEVRGGAPAGLLDTYDRERRAAGARALLQTRAQVALRRGHDAAADALRAVFQELLQDEQPSRRLAALVSGADVRYPEVLPGLGADDHAAGDHAADGGETVEDAVALGPASVPAADRHPLAGRFAPDLALHGNDAAASVAELLRTARPVLLVLADRPELLAVARPWADRVDVVTATADDRPADALLIRPDAHVAWAAGVGAPAGGTETALRCALEGWFGAP